MFAVLTQGTDSAGPPAALLAKAKANVTRFLGLLRRYSSGPAKQGYYLAGLSALVARDQAWLEVLPKVGPMAIKTTVITGHFQILHLLYDKDVLEDSAILSWMDQPGPESALKAAIRDELCFEFGLELDEVVKETNDEGKEEVVFKIDIGANR